MAVTREWQFMFTPDIVLYINVLCFINCGESLSVNKIRLTMVDQLQCSSSKYYNNLS